MEDYFPARPSEIRELEEYGDLIWSRADELPVGFCHDDLHNHNMILQDRSIALFDVASICDMTDFWTVTSEDVDSTLDCLDMFNSSYSKVGSLSDKELASVFDCIAVRHYRLYGIRDRIPLKGSSYMTEQWFSNLMKWMRDFRQLTERAV